MLNLSVLVFSLPIPIPLEDGRRAHAPLRSRRVPDAQRDRESQAVFQSVVVGTGSPGNPGSDGDAIGPSAGRHLR